MYCNYTDYAKSLDGWNLVLGTTETPTTTPVELSSELEDLSEWVATTESPILTTEPLILLTTEVEVSATTTEYEQFVTTTDNPLTTQEVEDTSVLMEIVSTTEQHIVEEYTTDTLSTPMTTLDEFPYEITDSTTQQIEVLLTTEDIPLTTIDLIEPEVIVTDSEDTTTGLDLLDNSIVVLNPTTLGYDETTIDNQSPLVTSTRVTHFLDIGLCELNVCQNGGTCVNTETGYKVEFDLPTVNKTLIIRVCPVHLSVQHERPILRDPHPNPVGRVRWPVVLDAQVRRSGQRSGRQTPHADRRAVENVLRERTDPAGERPGRGWQSLYGAVHPERLSAVPVLVRSADDAAE